MWLMDQSVTCPPNLHLVLENQTANQIFDLNLGQLWTSITLHFIIATPQRPVQFLHLVSRKTPKKGMELIDTLPALLDCLPKGSFQKLLSGFCPLRGYHKI